MALGSVKMLPDHSDSSDDSDDLDPVSLHTEGLSSAKRAAGDFSGSEVASSVPCFVFSLLILYHGFSTCHFERKWFA